MNVTAAEIAKFNDMAAYWWDATGPCQPLHAINPVRMQFIQEFVNLNGKTVIDVGCGGGILAESLARASASVTAIDLAEEAIRVARTHAESNQLIIDYHYISAEQMAAQHPGFYDVVCCLELLEHVPDPAALLKTLTQLLKPGGDLFLSTINRTLKAYCHVILGAEYILNWLPRGTHDYAQFIQPAELARWCRSLGLTTADWRGMRYNIFTRQYELCQNIDVNYLCHFKL